MFIEENREFVEDNINESESETEKFMKKINSSLFEMLKNPTDEQIKKFRDTRDALIVGWLAALMGQTQEDYYRAAQVGIDEADRQLKIKKLIKKLLQIKLIILSILLVLICNI